MKVYDFDKSQLDYDLCDKPVEELIIEKRRKEKCFEISDNMFDYMLGDDNSIRLEYIKEIKDNDKKIVEMSKYLKEIINQSFPDEFYDWYAREQLGLQYKKYEIDKMKRDYRIKKKRELKDKKEAEKKLKKINKEKSKKIQFIKGNKTLEFK